MVAADGDEPLAGAGVAEEREGLLLDLADCAGDVVGGAGDVAGVHNLGFVHGLDVELRVVAGAQEPRRFTDSGRTEAGAGAEGGTAVERDTDDRNVVVRHAVDLRKPGEGAQARVAGDFCCVDGADWLVRGHDRDPPVAWVQPAWQMSFSELSFCAG